MNLAFRGSIPKHKNSFEHVPNMEAKQPSAKEQSDTERKRDRESETDLDVEKESKKAQTDNNKKETEEEDPDVKRINNERLNEVCDEDNEFMIELLQTYKETTLISIKELGVALEKLDKNDSTFHAHDLKGSSANLGMDRVMKISARIESNILEVEALMKSIEAC
eukprot:TRINITY_DN1187_c0_g1_i1.p1 TRINITY_DN1187_c0_g1~~TRINITY_DN1187_c0_g1_i1.p1  ORF type:complete len:165 (-),score=37.09 TRINITY_DN1187_c0_g1_i1:3-497(-)